jgi:hypothetical protein
LVLVGVWLGSCGGSSAPGSKCLQLANDFCQCWVHFDFPPDPTATVITSCGTESIPPASGSGLFKMVPSCCAEVGYPASGSCFCAETDAPSDADCQQVFEGPATLVDRCATGGKLLTSNP